ncbi:MAG: APC family permease [Defluviitaleaceae bacterium]|nr:APC family permease [Defluviitaleaceae bacterium]
MNNNILKRQYGLFTSICIVVGFIVGTGIFWQPARVLSYAGGDVGIGVLAWVVGGLLILPCVYMFAVMAGRYEKVHGFVDYAEAIVGCRYGYAAGWFFCVMYQTAGYALIAYISATFTATVAGHENTTNSAFVFFIAAFYMVMTFGMNYLAPKIPMRLNIGTTIARLVPLFAIGTVGVVIGLATNESAALSSASQLLSTQSVAGQSVGVSAETNFLGAIFATVFAYNGWQAAAAFNSEVKNSKRNFPIALLLGFVVVMVIYVLYFIGVTTAGDAYALMGNAPLGTRAAFSNVFGAAAGNILMVFIIISGLGILNMCCMGMSRGMYAIARRGIGPLPHRMVVLDAQTNVPTTSMVACVALSFLWLMVLYGNNHAWFSIAGEPFNFRLQDFYNMLFFILLIPIFTGFFIKNRRDKTIHIFNRFIAPFFGIGGAGFLVYALAQVNYIHAAIYVLTFVVLMLVGFLFIGRKKNEG